MEIEITHRLATLGHPQRLAIFRLLMRRYPDQVPAGELASALDLRASTLSAYLAALLQAGLITQTRMGTSLLYAVNLQEVRATFDFLLEDCCNGRPEICAAFPPAAAPACDAGGKRSVLFVCTGNTARSIMAETILRGLAGDRFDVFSAGTRPATRVDPMALACLRDHGHDVSDLQPKPLSAFLDTEPRALDFIFTVCNQAANEFSAPWHPHPVSAHWGIPDPVASGGTTSEKRRAFEQAYATLHARLDAFNRVPLASLDRLALQSALDAIANIHPEVSA